MLLHNISEDVNCLLVSISIVFLAVTEISFLPDIGNRIPDSTEQRINLLRFQDGIPQSAQLLVSLAIPIRRCLLLHVQRQNEHNILEGCVGRVAETVEDHRRGSWK